MGVIVVPAHADIMVRKAGGRDLEYLKIHTVPVGWNFGKTKTDYIAAAAACENDNGTPFEVKGDNTEKITRGATGRLTTKEKSNA